MKFETILPGNADAASSFKRIHTVRPARLQKRGAHRFDQADVIRAFVPRVDDVNGLAIRPGLEIPGPGRWTLPARDPRPRPIDPTG